MQSVIQVYWKIRLCLDVENFSRVLKHLSFYLPFSTTTTAPFTIFYPPVSWFFVGDPAFISLRLVAVICYTMIANSTWFRVLWDYSSFSITFVARDVVTTTASITSKATLNPSPDIPLCTTPFNQVCTIRIVSWQLVHLRFKFFFKSSWLFPCILCRSYLSWCW